MDCGVEGCGDGSGGGMGDGEEGGMGRGVGDGVVSVDVCEMNRG